MSYQVLARKWRPRDFQTLVGQEHVSRVLIHALEQNRLHHAYLFTGTRGTGKTTIARILAKCLNCEQRISAIPCGQCAICRDIELGRFVDLIEIDAASKTKVEDTRELLDNVMYAPTQGRYKIYLIDEVHMLSGHSFNALLKTLEEPPEHVIFLLATTDPQKLPITVLSRCLQFQLKALTPEQIAPHLVDILTQEKITYDLNALTAIAYAAKGSVRDALSLLDQAIATGGGHVDTQTVNHMLGLQGQQLILPLAKNIFTKNITEVLALAQQLTTLAANFEEALDQLTTLFHHLSIKKLMPDFPLHSLTTSEADLAELLPLCDAQDLQMYYQIALLAKRDLLLAPAANLGFEMALLRMIAFILPAQESTTPKTVKLETKTVTAKKETIVSHPTASSITPAKADEWLELLPRLGLMALTKAFAEHLHFEKRERDHFYFGLPETHAALLQDRHRQRLEAALTQHLATPITLTITIGKSEQATASLFDHKKEQHQKKTELALKAFQEDKHLQKVLSNFEGKLIPESLELHEQHT